MSTAAQLSANLANAQLSTGPRTGSGKAISSQNALKHGLTAQTILLPGEDEEAYRLACQANFDFWEPANVTERELVQTLCDLEWRLHRCVRLEAAALSGDLPDFKTLDIISRHEARLKRSHSATLKELREITRARRETQLAALKQAMVIRRADRTHNVPTDLAKLGFDLSLEEVDSAIDTVDIYEQAREYLQQQDPGY